MQVQPKVLFVKNEAVTSNASSILILGGTDRGARLTFHTELFSSILSSEGAFSCIVDSLVQENVSGTSPQTS